MTIEIPFIAGSGRSGTTWVLDALARANGLSTIFEPLHPAVSAIGERFAFAALDPGSEEPALEAFFQTVANGRALRLWTNHRGRRDLLFPSPSSLKTLEGIRTTIAHWRFFIEGHREIPRRQNRRGPIVKCIRANLMLGWIKRRITSRVAMIVRHPAEVIHSQLAGPDNTWNPYPILSKYRGSNGFHELTGGRYRDILATDLSTIEAYATKWLIENQMPIEQAAIGHFALFRHDALIDNPDETWQSLCTALDLPRVPDFSQLTAPSQQGRRRSRSWAFSRSDALKMQAIFDRHGFTFFNMHGLDSFRSYKDGTERDRRLS